jgi:hypothetical protein
MTKRLAPNSQVKFWIDQRVPNLVNKVSQVMVAPKLKINTSIKMPSQRWMRVAAPKLLTALINQKSHYLSYKKSSSRK